MRQKVLPNPTVGLCLSVTSLRLQRTGPSGLRAARAGLDKSKYDNLFWNKTENPSKDALQKAEN